MRDWTQSADVDAYPLTTTTTAFAFVILFVGGMNMALPDYAWAHPFQIVHGVFIDNFLLLTYCFFMIVSGTIQRLMIGKSARRYAALVFYLAALGVISAGVNGYSLLDIGKAARLFLFSAFVLVAVHWARATRDNFVLRVFLMGIVLGGVINLYFTYSAPFLMIGPLSVLHSQNGAGGLLAISVSLAAWLMLTRTRPLDTVVAISTATVGLIAAALSFSKTAMTIASCGILAWTIVILYTFAKYRGRIAWGALAALVIGGFGASRMSTEASLYSAAVIKSVTIKFTGISVSNKYSVGSRYQYFFGVGEVLAAHPLFGVSYGGFYDAITHTANYQTGDMVAENAEAGARGESNPHNTFLLYAAANGVPGLILAILLYLSFLLYLSRSLEETGRWGLAITGCFALAYMFYAMTLPTAYDTDVVFVPVAVAIARIEVQRAARYGNGVVHKRRWWRPLLSDPQVSPVRGNV